MLNHKKNNNAWSCLLSGGVNAIKLTNMISKWEKHVDDSDADLTMYPHPQTLKTDMDPFTEVVIETFKRGVTLIEKEDLLLDQ
jgi:hypothetical protein